MKTKLFGLLTLTLSLHLFAFAGPPADEEFTAHEWGTFTSVQGADGVQIQWNPFIKTDLPRFVYSRAFPTAQGGNALLLKEALMSYVRMETPVIYFYSEKGLTADVTVEMPQGRITEWYPRATRIGPTFTTNKAEAKEAARSLIEWKGVNILPRDTKEVSAERLIREKEGNHYYEAREVDANFLRVASPHESGGAEYERDLFYRGIGYFKAPLTVELQDEGRYLHVSTTSADPMTDLFVLTIREGQARVQRLESVDRKTAQQVRLDVAPFAPLSEGRAQLMREMTAALKKQGLFAREAEAMVNTWKDQWFEEEGTRVLYLLPRSWTDRALPLTISPAPANIVRVMVGRAEMILPETERELRRQVTLYSKGDAAARAQSIAAVKKLGVDRFLEPAVRKMLGSKPDQAFSAAAWKLAQQVSKEIEAPAATAGAKVAALPSERATFSALQAFSTTE